MLQHAARALSAFRHKAFLGLAGKAVFATLLGLALAGWGLFTLLNGFFGDDWGAWGEVFSGFAIVAAGILLVLPVGSLVMGFLAEDAVRIVEARDYPATQGTHDVSMMETLGVAVRFLVRLVLLNLLALPVYLFLPGLNLAVFVGLNGYLTGREFFEMVALRHGGAAQVRLWRRRHGWRIFAGGVVIALAFAVPVLNILAPLFGAAMMVHLFQDLAPAGGAKGPDTVGEGTQS